MSCLHHTPPVDEGTPAVAARGPNARSPPSLPAPVTHQSNQHNTTQRTPVDGGSDPKGDSKVIITPEQFPIDRRNDPKRQAEAAVYDVLAESDRCGHAHYERGAPGRSRRTDFGLWLENVGRYAIEVKGGQYTFDPELEQWLLHTPDGLEAKSSPLQQADDSAMGLRNEIHRNTGFWVFIIPVVVFPDMGPDPVIEKYAQSTNVRVIWGAEHLLADLEAVARRIVVDHPPRASHIVNEVRAVTVGADCNSDGAAVSGQPRTNDAEPAVELHGAAHITIHHVERLIIQQAPEPTADCGL